MGTITIGIDLAKQVFSACEVDARGRVLQRRDFRRDAFSAWLPQVPTGTVVAMEACSGAHHWARRCQDYGSAPRLIAAQFVTPFRKSRTTTNDRNDAQAIATATRQGNMRFVPVKTVEQQARLTWHRCARAIRPKPWRPATDCAACWPSSAWWSRRTITPCEARSPTRRYERQCR